MAARAIPEWARSLLPLGATLVAVSVSWASMSARIDRADERVDITQASCVARLANAVEVRRAEMAVMERRIQQMETATHEQAEANKEFVKLLRELAKDEANGRVEIMRRIGALEERVAYMSRTIEAKSFP